MKILMLSAYDQPDRFQTRTFDNAKELTKLGHRVTVFTNSYCHFSKIERLNPDEKFRIDCIDGVKTVWIKTPPYKGNGFSRGLNMLFSFFRSLTVSTEIVTDCDAVLGSSSPPLTSLAAYIISKRHKAAFVHEIRDVWPDSLVSLGSISRISPIYFIFKLLEIFTYKKADKISTVVPFVLDHIKDNGGDSKDVCYIPTGKSFEKIGEPSRKEKETDLINVMYIGGFAKVHDILSIIDASEILRKKKHFLFTFTLIGYGEDKEFYENLVEERGNKFIFFKDPIDKDDVIPTARKSDILIHSIVDTPLTKWGTNPTKLYDYMSAGRPVICSFNSPNLPIYDANCGYSIEAGHPEKIADALIEFSKLTEHEKYSMGLRGYDYAKEHFNSQKLAKKLENLFLEAVNRAP